MKTIFFFILFSFALLFSATKDVLYFKGGQDDFAVDLAHPEKGTIKLPVGSANIQNIVEHNGYIFGITKPEYENRSPIVFLYSVEKNAILDYLELDPKKLQLTLAHGLISDGKHVYCALFNKEGNGGIVKIAETNGKLVLNNIKQTGLKGDIFCILLSNDKSTIYGITAPANTFFSFSLINGNYQTIKGAEISTEDESSARLIHFSSGTEHICKSLVSDKKGRVYGTTGMGKIFRFDPLLNTISILQSSIPYVQYRRATNRVESWVLSEDGIIYGSTSIDGILFKLDPESDVVYNLGKVTHAGNIHSLIYDKGMIYGICGKSPEYSHLFYYNTKTGSFEDLGIPRFRNTLINARHMSYFLSDMITLSDGRVVFAESDLLPFLVFWKK